MKVTTSSKRGILVGLCAGLLWLAGDRNQLVGLAERQTPVPTVSVTLNVSRLILHPGQTFQLAATTPSGTGQRLPPPARIWQSSDPAIVVVSPSGLVTAMGAGVASVSVVTDGAAAFVEVVVPDRVPETFNLSREIQGGQRTLSAAARDLDPTTGSVTIGGADSRRPSAPFRFDWGDGTTSVGFFNQSHRYHDTSRNYVVRVTAVYSSTETDAIDVLIRFVRPQIAHGPIDDRLAVIIPDTVPTLGTRLYRPPQVLLPLDGTFFSAALHREDVEYVLSQAAAVQYAMIAGDVEVVDGGFRQFVFRDPGFAGAYSIWYSTPVALAVAGSFISASPDYSSLFHEIGHNVSLNSPAAFRYGGRIDGAANAIFSESIAQMFQHATAYELVNNAARYGIPSDLAHDIAARARSSANLVRSTYETYVSQGKPFATWNDPITPIDETFGTFMVVARQFILHAENAHSYVVPLSRTMRLLRTFNPGLQEAYAQSSNSPAASAFRATLMVAALSYGFEADLRDEFRALNFEIDDAAYARLIASVP